MSQPIISVENLGKSYLIGHQSSSAGGYTALRDVVSRTVKDFGRKALSMARGQQIIQGDEVEEFWALKDVSFDVQQGEVLGIIGRNGAGKSTLLKILSRITESTEGRVTLRGRVASLLEVGTGFHPELTGRENIFLNGAILGMTRSEIKRKFDEIVDFSGVEKFLDTPVKRYSSGMYVRLAFAVAAHLEPEILVVDEVLAVGDAEFQKKCLGKMQDVAAGGRTVLFVSHNMAAIQALCTEAILLEGGTVTASGAVSDVVSQYSTGELTSSFSRSRPSTQEVFLREGHVTIENRSPGDVRLCLDLVACATRDQAVGLELRIKDSLGADVGWSTVGALRHGDKLSLEEGWSRITSVHDISQLANGRYQLNLYLTIPDIEYLDLLEDVIRFEINASPVEGANQRMQQSSGFGSVQFPDVSHALSRVHEPANV